MIPNTQQWAIQIDVTNVCGKSCSNCTRMLAHARERFVMDVATFSKAVSACRDFLVDSEPDRLGRHKVLGIIGGEPLLHPQFSTLCQIMLEQIPDKRQRGLWTSLDWQKSKHAEIIAETFGYFNVNRHDRECRHQPVLAAVQELEPERMWDLIRACPLQEEWASNITPRGAFFCEVAGSFDMVFSGPGGKPIEPGWWDRPLSDFEDQIQRWCPRCGVCVPWKQGRLDCEEVDDITPRNLADLTQLGSPRAVAGKVALCTQSSYAKGEQGTWKPLRYLK